MGLGMFLFGILQVNVLLWFVFRLFSDSAICLVVGNPPLSVPKTTLLHSSCSACLCSSPDLQGCVYEMKVELHWVAGDNDGADKESFLWTNSPAVSLRKRGELLEI